MYALFTFKNRTVVRYDYLTFPRGLIRNGSRPISLEFNEVPIREWFREEIHWFNQCKMALSQDHRTSIRFFQKATRPDFVMMDDPQKESLTQCEIAEREEKIAALKKKETTKETKMRCNKCNSPILHISLEGKRWLACSNNLCEYYSGLSTPTKLNVTLDQYLQETERIKSMSQSINTVGLKDEEILKSGGTQFNTGAVRSADASGVMYQLISPIGLRRIAETYKEGFDKYGSYNWERGMPIGDILNHGIRHIYEYLSGDRSEDHLAHAAWNLIAAMHMEESHPELEHGLRPEKPKQ